MANEAEKTLHKMQQVLTIDANGAYETEEDKAELLWHELQNAYRSKRILSGALSGVEETSSGSIAVIYYKGQAYDYPCQRDGAESFRTERLWRNEGPSGSYFK